MQNKSFHSWLARTGGRARSLQLKHGSFPTAPNLHLLTAKKHHLSSRVSACAVQRALDKCNAKYSLYLIKTNCTQSVECTGLSIQKSNQPPSGCPSELTGVAAFVTQNSCNRAQLEERSEPFLPPLLLRFFRINRPNTGSNSILYCPG